MKQNDDQNLSYNDYINHTCNSTLTGFAGQYLNYQNFYLQCVNCVMICILSLQSEIFSSFGYHKFVTKKDGMEHFVKLASIKAKSVAYTYNNYKLKKIFGIQKRKF